MRHRENAAVASTVAEYYRINIYLPFVDHCLNELTTRFHDVTRPSFLAFKLQPNQIGTLTHKKLIDIKEKFRNDLPDMDGFSQELDRWKVFL
jgi:hypothetical protein